MRFNEHGDVAQLRRDWFDHRTISQDCSSGVCGVYLSDGTPIFPNRDAGAVVGRAGKWAAGAWTNSYRGAFAWNGEFPGAAISAEGAGPNGEYGLKLAYHSFGPWDVVDPDGLRWRLTDGDAGNIQLLGNRRAIWMENGDGWLRRTPGLNITPPNEPAWGFRACEREGRFVVLYQRRATGEMVLDGRVILPSGDYFYFDVRWDGTRYHVAWSPNQADTDPQFFSITPEELARKPEPRAVTEDSPDTPPESEPTPDPEPDPMPEPTSLLPDVEAEYAKYTKPLKPEDYGAILNAVAWKHRADGWGLSVKPDGNRVPSPQGVDVAYDILHHKPTDTLWGCFGDTGPNWGLEHPHGRADRPWLAPIPPSGGDDGDPGDEDDGVPDSGTDVPNSGTCTCAAELKALHDLVHEALEAAHHARVDLENQLHEVVKAANDRLTKLENASVGSFNPAGYYAEGRIGVAEVLRNDTVQWQIKERK